MLKFSSRSSDHPVNQVIVVMKWGLGMNEVQTVKTGPGYADVSQGVCRTGTSRQAPPPANVPAPAAVPHRNGMTPTAVSPERAAPVNPAERRRFSRVGFSTEVSLESVDNFYTGFTEDISEGGLFLSTYELQPIGTEVALSFRLPTDRVVSVVGVVRWVRDPRDGQEGVSPGLGIQFSDIGADDKQAIQSFVRQRAPLFYED